MIQEAEELLSVGSELGIKIEILDDYEANMCIHNALEKFKPFKITNHIGIGHDSFCLPIDEWEFSYTKYLPKESGYIFFEQSSILSRKTVIKIDDINLFGKVIENSFGMEYFLTNKNSDFLIAVNWYVVEVAGKIEKNIFK